VTQVVKLAVAVARAWTSGRVLDRVLADNLREAMRLVVTRPTCASRSTRAQKQTLDEALVALKLEWPQLRHVELIEDATLEPAAAACSRARVRSMPTSTASSTASWPTCSRRRRPRPLRRNGRRPCPYRKTVRRGGAMSVLAAQLEAVDGSMPFRVVGQVQAVSGMTLEAIDLTLPLGSLCKITSFGGKTATAEVIGFPPRQDAADAADDTAGVARGDRIESSPPPRASGARPSCSAASSTASGSRPTARARCG
jgi:hypothetical protein